MSRQTTWTQSIQWLEAHLRQYKVPSLQSLMTGISLTMWQDGFWNWTGEGIPWKGNYSSWLEQKAQDLLWRRNRRAKGEKPWRESWVGENVSQSPPVKIQARLRLREMGEDGRSKEEKLKYLSPRASFGEQSDRH